MKSKHYFVITALCILLIGNARAQDTWTQKGDFSFGARSGAVAFSINSKGYLGTGNDSINGLEKDLWSYDPIMDTWTQKADLPGDPRQFAVGFAIGNYGYVGTGDVPASDPANDFWQYDPGTNIWTQKADFPGGKRYYAVGFNIGEKGYVGTGTNNFNSFRKDFYEYDPATDTWTQKADFGGKARVNAVGFSIGNKGYIGTGRVVGVGVTNDFWEYDPTNDAWTRKADYAGAGWNYAVGFSIGTKSYIGTGWDNQDEPTNDFWEYDQLTDSWTQQPNFPGTPRFRSVGFSIGDKGYIGTGDDGGLTKDFYEFSTTTCTPPTALTTTNITNIKATLSWNAVSGAVKYKLRYRVSGNNPWTNVGSTTTTRKINELTANTTYQWQVRTVCSIDPSVSSDWSAKQSFSTSMRLSEEKEISRTQVYPNPLTSSSTLSFSLEKNSHTTIELFDVAGRKINTLLDEQLDAGNHTIALHAETLPAGVYFIKMQMEEEEEVVKVVVE